MKTTSTVSVCHHHWHRILMRPKHTQRRSPLCHITAPATQLTLRESWRDRTERSWGAWNTHMSRAQVHFFLPFSLHFTKINLQSTITMTSTVMASPPLSTYPMMVIPCHVTAPATRRETGGLGQLETYAKVRFPPPFLLEFIYSVHSSWLQLHHYHHHPDVSTSA